MRTKGGLFLIIFIITIRAGLAQVQEKIEYPNLVKNGDFEDGNVGFKSDFKYADTYSDFNWGSYVITDNAAQYQGGGVFVNPVPNTGKYYFIDMNHSGKQRLWYDSITVKPNTTYSFSCFGANVCTDFQNPGVMNLNVNGKKVCPSRVLSGGSPAWKPLSIPYKTGTEETRIEISIVDEIWTLMGNDVALDNIVFRQISPEVIPENKVIFAQGLTDTLGRKWAKKELNSALIDITQHIVNKDPNFTTLDSLENAIKFAETILFDIYGKEQIERERPYEIYNIDNYWVISGTLRGPPESCGYMFGGTFLIVFNARNGKVIRITHGK